MKEMFLIEDTPADKISYYHLMAFLVALPFDRFYCECILISLSLHTTIHLTKKKIASIDPVKLLPVLLYLLTLAGTWYIPGRTQALFDLQKQFALVLLPLVFACSSLDFVKYKLPLLKTFALTCVLVISFLFGEAWRVIHFLKLP